jgi:hypothetical protein
MTTPEGTGPQEAEGVRGRLVAAVLLAVAIATAFAAVVVSVWLGARRAPAPAPASVKGAVGGILETPIDGPSFGGDAARSARAELRRFEWIDRERTLARIPIDAAMRWLADDAKRGPIPEPDPASNSRARGAPRGTP